MIDFDRISRNDECNNFEYGIRDFQLRSSFKSFVYIPSNVTSLPVDLFRGRSEIHFVQINPESPLSAIPARCFYGCSLSNELINIILSKKTINSLGSYCFRENSGSKSVPIIIPDNIDISKISDNVFFDTEIHTLIINTPVIKTFNIFSSNAYTTNILGTQTYLDKLILPNDWVSDLYISNPKDPSYWPRSFIEEGEGSISDIIDKLHPFTDGTVHKLTVGSLYEKLTDLDKEKVVNKGWTLIY